LKLGGGNISNGHKINTVTLLGAKFAHTLKSEGLFIWVMSGSAWRNVGVRKVHHFSNTMGFCFSWSCKPFKRSNVSYLHAGRAGTSRRQFIICIYQHILYWPSEFNYRHLILFSIFLFYLWHGWTTHSIINK
jgi:hypothetical protein